MSSASGTGRIFVTGIGLATPLAVRREATWDKLVAGERGLRPIDTFDTTGQRASLGGVVADLVMPDVDAGAGVVWSRSSALALTAAREAMEHANIAGVRGLRIGLVLGGTTGGMFETESHLAELHANPEAHTALLQLLTHPLSASGDSLHTTLGPFLRVRTLSTACSSGANAMILAASWLLSGDLDVVVAGGSDGLCRLTLSGFNALAAVDPEPCRPFDRTRRGLNVGEGAGFLVLERGEHARARGARVIAELAGWSLGSEAHHITNPEATGRTAGRVIAEALSSAGLTPSSVDYVNAHGTGTPLNDPMEAAALRMALGADIERVPVSSSKGQIGHTLAAAGGIEAGIAALVIERQTIVPTAGLTEPDPACNLVHVYERGRAARVRAVISNSFGFGGMDSSLVLTEPELGPPHGYRRRSVVVTGAATLTPAGLEGLATADASIGERPAPIGMRITEDLAKHLEVARARRLDRPARVQAVVVQQALADASLDARSARVGLVMGSSFGSLDASAAFMHRVFERGPRFASPADFPNLVPSSPVGHVSIYTGMEGPVLAAADFTTSGEGACAMAIELVESGVADAVVGGAFEEESRIVERRLSVTAPQPGMDARRPRAEGAGVAVFESEEHARARGARIVARVEELRQFREEGARALEGLTPPHDATKAIVIFPRRDPNTIALADACSWRDVPRLITDGAGGDHEALGAVAIAAAAALLARGPVREVLVLSATAERGYAVRLTAP